MSRNTDYARRKGKNKGPSFLQIFHYVYDCAAYRDLDPVARALYAALRRRYNGSNNGTIGLGCREAAEELKVTARTISRAFHALEEHGFVRITADSTFDQKRRSREWLLTEMKDDRSGALSTRDFMRWTPKPEIMLPVRRAAASAKIVPLRGRHAAA